jgi:DNA repair protein RadA/Sms
MWFSERSPSVPAKARTVYICQQCGARQAKWAGRCPDCGAWNSLVETVERPEPAAAALRRGSAGPGGSQALALPRIPTADQSRLRLAMDEFNRVLGGGIVPGSVVLMGGDPGIGKSTLLLQVCGAVARDAGTVLYVAAEESAQQVKLRADRLGINAERLLILPETDLATILGHLEADPPVLAVVDSIQSVATDDLSASAGSVSQVRECAQRLVHLAKQRHVPIFLVGHVTKEGAVAGPRVLEHMVDVVLYLEGERVSSYRILRGVKNRFGSTDEIGLFEMSDAGLTEVADSAALFFAGHSGPAPGTVAAVTTEGTRPLLVEVQGLAAPTSFGLPRRSANGFDVNRLYLLLAVLSRRAGVPLGSQDVYVNVVGGVRLTEPAADLAVTLAVASSLRDQAVPEDMAVAGEVGLSGELRPVRQLERRRAEAERLGFKRLLVPASGSPVSRRAPARHTAGIEIVEARWVTEALERALGPAPRAFSGGPSRRRDEGPVFEAVAREQVLDFGIGDDEEEPPDES